MICLMREPCEPNPSPLEEQSPSHVYRHVTVSFAFAFFDFYLLIFAIKANIVPSKHWASEVVLAQDPGPNFQA